MGATYEERDIVLHRVGELGMTKAGKKPGRASNDKAGQEMHGETTESGEATGIDPRIQREIGKQLRAHYDNVINEPVPDKLMQLLEQLEQSTSRKS